MEFGGVHQHLHPNHRDEEDEEEEEEGSEEMLMMTNSNNNNMAGSTNPDSIHINNSTSSLNRVKMVEASLSQVQIHQPIITSTPPPTASSNSSTTTKPRYRECLRNHAINVMGHALDGCGEFMPGGPEGSVEALKCAACSCHRNFHRKEDPTDHHHHHSTTAVLYSHTNSHLHHRGHQQSSGPFGSYCYRTSSTTNTTAPSGYLHLGPPPQPRPLALPSASGGGGGGGSQSRGEEEEEDVSDPIDADDVHHHHNGVGGMNMMMMMRNGGGGGKKRFRTKFTAEQKERMFVMAERIGWRIQKCDEDLVQQFCHETGVKRHVFKVWMHNNKHTLGKSTTSTGTNSSNLNINNNSSSSNTSSRQQQQLMN